MTIDEQIAALSGGMEKLQASLDALGARIDAFAAKFPATDGEAAKPEKSAPSATKKQTTAPSTTEKEAPASTEKATPTAVATDGAGDQSSEIEYSQVKDLIFKIAKDKGRQAAADLLATFGGATKGQDLDESDWAKFLEEGAKVLEGDLA